MWCFRFMFCLTYGIILYIITHIHIHIYYYILYYYTYIYLFILYYTLLLFFLSLPIILSIYLLFCSSHVPPHSIILIHSSHIYKRILPSSSLPSILYNPHPLNSWCTFGYSWILISPRCLYSRLIFPKLTPHVLSEWMVEVCILD